MTQVIIGGTAFDSKKGLEDSVRTRLSKLPSTPTPMDLDPFWMDLIGHCESLPRKLDQLAGECVAIASMDNARGKGKSLGLFSDIGDYVPFSWKACVENAFGQGKPFSQAGFMRDFHYGLRQAIRPQIEAYRRSVTRDGMVRCEATGELLPSRKVHIDHDPIDFVILADEFVGWAQSGILKRSFGMDDVVRTHAFDPQHMQIADPGLNMIWQEYHRERAQLRAVSERINLSKKKASRNYD